jgi:hypothetical protein
MAGLPFVTTVPVIKLIRKILEIAISTVWSLNFQRTFETSNLDETLSTGYNNWKCHEKFKFN